jgi:predicted nucleic acid-binding protein
VKGYLIDTNVISELRKGDRCNGGVRDWFTGVDGETVYFSSLVIGELRRGIERIRRRDPASAQRLEAWLKRLKSQYRHRILAVTEEIAELWGQFGIDQPVPPIDGLLAATALYHDLALVTRNTEDVSRTPVRVLNPFT